MVTKAYVFFLSLSLILFLGCSLSTPPAPTTDFTSDLTNDRGPQSSTINPFESSTLLVPNIHFRDAEYSKKYWRSRAGLDLWTKATFGNASDLKNLDWFQILRTDQRGRARFEKWGLISDPECCTPGKNCDEKFPDRKIPDTHGYDYCAGDENMSTEADPACDFRDMDGRTRTERKERFDTLSRTSCDLKFGWPSGVLGIRKFLNPENSSKSSPRPYLFGVSCAVCHAGLHPLRAIRSLDQVAWSQMSLNVGNPYLRLPKMLATGVGPATWLAHHLSNTPPGRLPSTLAMESLDHLNKVSLIANLASRPQFESVHIDGPRFFINGTEILGLEHYLAQKVRGLVSFATRGSLPEFDIRAPALTEFVSSFRAYQLPKDLLPPSAARERGSKIYAQKCATCHSSLRPLEVMDRLDRSIRMQESPVESAYSDFYSGANFLARRADDESLRMDYLSNEMDVSANGQFDACSTQGRLMNAADLPPQFGIGAQSGSGMSEHSGTRSAERLGNRITERFGNRVMKNVSLLNPWLRLPLLSRGNVGLLPRVLCTSPDDLVCLKNKTYELRRAMKELLEPSQNRRTSPLYLTSNWHVHLDHSNVNWTLPSGTSWPLIDQFRVDDFDQDLADSRRTAHGTVARASHDAANGVIQLIEKFLRIYQPMSVSNSTTTTTLAVSSAVMLSPQMSWNLQLGRVQTEALLRAYSSCPDAAQVHRFTESTGHNFGVDLKPEQKKDLVEFLISL